MAARYALSVLKVMMFALAGAGKANPTRRQTTHEILATMSGLPRELQKVDP